MKADYTPIDLENWSRGGLYRHFTEELRITMNLTVDIDVTKLLAYAKSHGLRFYPCMIWIVSKVLNAHDEFKYSRDAEGKLIRWNFISPSYTVFHKEDESFAKYVTEYCDDLFEFHRRFETDAETNRRGRAFIADQPLNFFDVSCIPWVRYAQFNAQIYDDGTYLAPIVTWGKFEEDRERLRMPLTMSIHHAVADGFHLSRFFIEAQALIDSLPKA